MKVLFIYPNTMMANLVPLSIAVLTSYLDKNGIDVSLFDTTFYKTEEISFEERKVDLLMLRPFSYEDEGITFKEGDIFQDLRDRVEQFKPDLVAITVVENMYDLSRSLLESIKDFDIPVIAGGVFPTLNPDEVISNDTIDMICIGEGEHPLEELCNRMESGEDYSTIQNLWVKQNGKVVKNSLRQLIDINELPFINYDVFEEGRLCRAMFGKILTTIHVEIDRGCPNDCTYCCASYLRNLFRDNGCGKYYRRKTPERAVAEIKYLADMYNPDYVMFNSETFLIRSVEELREFSRLYVKVGVPFWVQTRPETITDEKVKILKEMGCANLQFGIETGNEEFRKKVLNRRGTNQQLLEALWIVEKYDITYSVNNIIGFPDETRELVFDTIELNRQINPSSINCYILSPYRGTRLFDVCVEKGYLDKDAKINQVLDGVRLNMDSITYEELKGLQRTFLLYVKFPKSDWPEIKMAEQSDEVFQKLKKKYHDERK